MADPTLVVRVAANLSEFKSNLAEGVDQVETYKSALSRAASAFDGSRIVQQAGAAAAAIQNTGGVTSLTAAEMAKANVIFSDAAAKLELMGKGSSYQAQQFAALAEATKQVKAPTEELGVSWVERIAEGLLLRDAIKGVLSQIKEIAVGVPEEAHALNLLSLQTQMNVEDLQVLTAATREYGVDGEQLGKALYQLGRRIAGGDESVATAYHLMGMSLGEVRDMNGMELFLATERGLGKLHGTIRDTAAADLYGGRLGVSMGAFSTGVDEAIAKARSLNTIASTESVKALAEYQDAVDRATHSVHAWFIELEGGAVLAAGKVKDAIHEGTSKTALFAAAFKDVTEALLSGSVPSMTRFTALVAESSDKTAENTKAQHENVAAHEDVSKALDAHGQATRFMASLELDAAKPLLAWQEDYLQHLKDIGELNAKNAAGIGVTADQLKHWTKATEDASHATEELYKQADEFDKLLEHMDKETFTLAMEHEKQWREESVKQTNRVNAAILAELDAQTKLNGEYGRAADGSLKVSSASETLRLALEKLHLQKVDGISQEKEEQVLMDAYTKALYDEAVAQDKVTASAQKTSTSFVEGAQAAKTFADGVSFLVTGMANYLQKGQAGWFGWSPGGADFTTATINTALRVFQNPTIGGGGSYTPPPARAGGGPVQAGETYTVGERGPETLVMGPSSGYVMPNSGGSGAAPVVNIYVTQPLGTPAALAAAVGPAVIAGLRAQGVKLPVGV